MVMSAMEPLQDNKTGARQAKIKKNKKSTVLTSIHLPPPPPLHHGMSLVA